MAKKYCSGPCGRTSSRWNSTSPGISPRTAAKPGRSSGRFTTPATSSDAAPLATGSRLLTPDHRRQLRPYLRQFRPLRACSAILDELRVIRPRFLGLFRQLCRPARAKQSIESIWIRLEPLLVLDQRFLRPIHFEQHVRQHLARWEFDLTLPQHILFIRDRPHQRQSFVVLPLCEREPCPCFVTPCLHAVSKIRVL